MRTYVVVMVGLFFACGSATGALAPPVNVSQTSGFWSVNASMDFDSTGGIHMSYYDWTGSTIRLFYARRVGDVWQNTLLASYYASSGRMSGPMLAVTPDDVIHIGYGIEHDIHEITKPVTGGSWSSPARIDEMNGSETWINGLECDSSGGLYFVYTHLFDQDAGIYGRYKPLGGSWQPSELIKPAASDDSSRPVGAHLTAHGDTFYVSYQWKNTKVGYYRERSPGGTWWPEAIVAAAAYGPSVAVSPDGSEMALVYFYNRGNCDLDFTVFAKFSTDGGATWSAEEAVSDNCWISRGSCPVYDVHNNLHIFYQRNERDGDDFDVWMRSRMGGRWGRNINLTDNYSRSGVSAAITRDGAIYLSYSDNFIDGEYEEVYFTRIAPQIVADPDAFATILWAGETAEADTLSISTGNTGTIAYALAEDDGAGGDISWLTLSSNGGTVSGAPDAVTLTYHVGGLPQDLYTGSIVLTTDDAYESPLVIPVSLEIQSVTPDIDTDNDVDMDDFAELQRCLTGEFNPVTDLSCSRALLDGDNDIDQYDVAVLIGCLSGPGVPVDRNCE